MGAELKTSVDGGLNVMLRSDVMEGIDAQHPSLFIIPSKAKGLIL